MIPILRWSIRHLPSPAAGKPVPIGHSRHNENGHHSKLAQNDTTWHMRTMQKQTSNASRAGGAIIAFLTLAGALTGVKMGQPSIGMIAGFGAGVLIAIGLFLYDRRREA